MLFQIIDYHGLDVSYEIWTSIFLCVFAEEHLVTDSTCNIVNVANPRQTTMLITRMVSSSSRVANIDQFFQSYPISSMEDRWITPLLSDYHDIYCICEYTIILVISFLILVCLGRPKDPD